MSHETFVQRLGRERLQVISQLGEGAAGTVYRVRDRQTGGQMALKVLREASPHAVLRFQREATLTASLSHPNIVTLRTTGVFEGRCFIGYELIEGARSLDEAFHGAPLARRIELLRDAALGLGHAHERGVVHRDVKPENVLVGEDGCARVTDFGLALTEDAERLTRTGAIVGTPFYMAPEQVDGKRGQTGPPTDVWALGVLLYEALTDERPFDGGSLLDLASAITTAAPRPPSHVCRVPAALEDLCLRALRGDPAARPRDGGAFAAELDAWLAKGGAVRTPWRRRLRWAGAALAGALALGAALAWSLSPSASGESAGADAAAPTSGSTSEPEASAVVEDASRPELPSWQGTLGGAATYRVQGRSRLGADEPWSMLELTIAQEAPAPRGDRVVAAARVLRVRCQASSLLEVDYDSDHPTPPPINHLDDLVEAVLAARVELEFDARTYEVLAVRGLPVRDGMDTFLRADGRTRESVSHALRPLARWFSAAWARTFLHGLPLLPPPGAGPSFTGRYWWTDDRWLELPRRLQAGEGGRFTVALDGPARMFRDGAGRAAEVRVADVHYEGTVEVKDGAVVRAGSALRFEDHDGAAPVESVGEIEFELLRRGG